MLFEEHIANFLSKISSLSFEEVKGNLSKVPTQFKLKKGLGDYCLHLKKFGKDRAKVLTDTFNTSNNNNATTNIKNSGGDDNVGAFNKDSAGVITQLKVVNSILNVYVNTSIVTKKVLEDIYIYQDQYGSSEPNGQKIIVEFSSPNIAKPFHAGHLRSTILGQFLSNLFRFGGYDVVSMNYLGDWGKQFGILGLGLQRFDLSVEDIEACDDPIAKLNEIYVKMNQTVYEEESSILAKLGITDKETAKRLGMPIESQTDLAAKRFFSELENGDPEKKKIWEYIRRVSLQKYQSIYDRLNIHFDVYSGESKYGRKYIPEELIDHPSLVTSKTLYVDLESEGLGKFVIVKQDGSSLYSLRDITAALDRYQEYKFDKMLYVVSSEQDHYFKRLFTVLGLINGELSEKCEHISFGLVEGMSTRKGTVILLESILDRAKSEMKKKILLNEQKLIQAGKEQRVTNIDETASVLGKSAIYIQDFKAERTKNYQFEWSRATDFEGQTGPYLQYSHARLYGIIEKAKQNGITLESLPDDYENYIQEREAQDIIFELTDYKGVVTRCMEKYEAQPLVHWLFNFVKCVFKAYKKISVVKCDNPKQAVSRLMLYVCCKIVIGNSLKLLGLTPLEKM